jgi:pimeloyl-ACP methyl ester carboxylesterase
VRTVTAFASASSDAIRTVLLHYLRCGTPLRLLRIARRAHTDDPTIDLAIFRACATADYPVEESMVRDAVARDGARGFSSFPDLAMRGRQDGSRSPGPPLSELDKPVLVMCGDADPVCLHRASRDTAAGIPGARLVVLAGVGPGLPRTV